MRGSTGFIPNDIAQIAVEWFNPRKSVIVDMVMIQLLSMTLTLLSVLLFKGDQIDSSSMAWMVAGLFGSFLLASAVYSRITSI
jgi:succinate-acetate transporter protein